MTGNSPVTPDSVLEKFEFFFLGLTFTLLGASIQTADFANSSSVSVIAEIIGWAGLALSGLVGLSKIEYLPVLIHLRSRKDEFKEYKSGLERARALGTTQARIAQTGDEISVDDVILKVEKKLSRYTGQLDKVGKWHGVKHISQKWSFVFGLIVIAIARAHDAIRTIT